MMENELRQFLTAMEARFNERIDNVVERLESRVSERIDDMGARLEMRFNERIDDKINESEARLIQRMDDMGARLEARFNERMEKVETSLLTAFHQWASPAEMRARTHSAAIRALDIEVESLADRLTKLDGGALNI